MASYLVSGVTRPVQLHSGTDQAHSIETPRGFNSAQPLALLPSFSGAARAGLPPATEALQGNKCGHMGRGVGSFAILASVTATVLTAIHTYSCFQSLFILALRFFSLP